MQRACAAAQQARYTFQKRLAAPDGIYICLFIRSIYRVLSSCAVRDSASIARILTQEHIYLYALLSSLQVRDGKGRKMSKSLGNVIDPLHVMEGVTLETLQEGVEAARASLGDKEVGLALSELKRDFPNGIAACGAYTRVIVCICERHLSLSLSLCSQRATCSVPPTSRCLTHDHHCNLACTRFTRVHTCAHIHIVQALTLYA